MVIAEHQAKLTDIQNLINQVPRFPISVKRLLEVAKQSRINKEVITFYQAFPESAIFSDRDDMLSRTEAVEIMQSENQPAEDEVRGAED